MSCHNKRKWSHLRTIRIDPLHSGWKRWIRLTEFPACYGDFTRFRFQTLIESHFHDHFGITGVITLRHWIEILVGLNWQLRPVFTRWAVSSAPEQWPSALDYLHHAKIFGCWLATTWMEFITSEESKWWNPFIVISPNSIAMRVSNLTVIF